MVASGPNSSVVADFLSDQLAQCRSWLIDNRLSLHTGKTECILFGTHRRLKGADFIIKCGDAVIKRVTSVKYLGVTLDQFLNFREHAIEILKKANAKLSFLYRCGACLSSKYRQLLCSALINSGLEYCCSAWYSGLLRQYQKDLSTLQRKMVRYVQFMGPREHIGNGDICSLGWLPFPKRVEFYKMMHVFKVRWSLAPTYMRKNFILVSDTHTHSLRQSGSNFSIAHCPFPNNSFTRSAITLWNSLPLSLKATHSRQVFKKGLVSFLKNS